MSVLFFCPPALSVFLLKLSNFFIKVSVLTWLKPFTEKSDIISMKKTLFIVTALNISQTILNLLLEKINQQFKCIELPDKDACSKTMPILKLKHYTIFGISYIVLTFKR